MRTKDLDIVYCLKESQENEELRYSLRSLKNLPHNKVWFYGGCPKWAKNINHVAIKQNNNKWENAALLLKNVVENEEISEDFIWFNDDFFIMKRIFHIEYYYDRTLWDRVHDFERKNWFGFKSQYAERLEETAKVLKNDNTLQYNYELHVPIIFNKSKLKEMLSQYPDLGAKRSIYCNKYVSGALPTKDVKIYTNTELPKANNIFVSTCDSSFANGQVGKMLRNTFKDKCRYEK